MNKNDFPIFNHYPDLVYLDSAASAQKPTPMLDYMNDFALTKYANVHRGNYYLSELSTQAFEEARHTIAEFLRANDKDIIFVRGATEGINLVAQTYGRGLQKGDEILISQAEHHSNFVPWQMLAKEKGILLKFINILSSGELDMQDFNAKLNKNTKLVAITQLSNVLGVVNPIEQITKQAHQVGAKVLIDGCQGIVHIQPQLRKWDVDFYAFSGHKLYGPTGIGVLYGKEEIMNTLPPWQGGGDMIENVSFTQTTYAQTPARFEAGTPAIVEAIGLMAGCEYVKRIGYAKIEENEKQLMQLLADGLATISGIEILGDIKLKKSLVCFNLTDLHPQDVSMLLAEMNVAVRVGHHCAQPITEKYGFQSSIRASLGLYNDGEDIERFIIALKKVQKILQGVKHDRT